MDLHQISKERHADRTTLTPPTALLPLPSMAHELPLPVASGSLLPARPNRKEADVLVAQALTGMKPLCARPASRAQDAESVRAALASRFPDGRWLATPSDMLTGAVSAGYVPGLSTAAMSGVASGTSSVLAAPPLPGGCWKVYLHASCRGLRTRRWLRAKAPGA